MNSYRVKEKIYSDGRSEFVPEFYHSSHFNRFGDNMEKWYSIAESSKRFLGQGYKTIEEAKIIIENHKTDMHTIGEVIREKIHSV